MKHRIIAPLFLLISMLLWNDSRAHCHITQPDTPILSSTEPSSILEALPYIDLRFCINAGPFSVCITLRCDLHWTDILQPGLGQLLGHEGCKIVGQATAPNSTPSQFEGNAENMIQSLEVLMKIPKGTLQNLTVTTSPTFPLPDGNDYRVVAKTYPVLNGTSGRYIPFEVEVVNKK